MESQTLLAGMPVLSLVTNFTPDGGFERIHLITGHKAAPKAVQNRMRSQSEREAHAAWNGPALNLHTRP